MHRGRGHREVLAPARFSGFGVERPLLSERRRFARGRCIYYPGRYDEHRTTQMVARIGE
jgi:hypothetical protein